LTGSVGSFKCSTGCSMPSFSALPQRLGNHVWGTLRQYLPTSKQCPPISNNVIESTYEYTTLQNSGCSN
jgi:hypothetical protein